MTAYDVRISDWSSDVCSSDLRGVAAARGRDGRGCDPAPRTGGRGTAGGGRRLRAFAHAPAGVRRRHPPSFRAGRRAGTVFPLSQRRAAADRSEEHTSELQSLMRISYAVFCLKTKKTSKIEYKQ